GIAVGTSPRMGELATVATLLVLVTLSVLNRLENILRCKVRYRTLEVELVDTEGIQGRLLEQLIGNGVIIYGLEAQSGQSLRRGEEEVTTRRLVLRVQLPGTLSMEQLQAVLMQEDGMVSFDADRV